MKAEISFLQAVDRQQRASEDGLQESLNHAFVFTGPKEKKGF